MNRSRMSNLAEALRRRLAQSGRRRRGMTLVEVMIVIILVVTLMSILAFGVFGQFAEANRSAAELQINKLNEQVRIFQLKKKKLPSKLEDVFIDGEVPKDPWGNEYVFKQGGGKNGYDIVSFGADGKEGGTGEDADIKLSGDGGGEGGGQ
ncbi:MAG: hypothetical protein RLZZ383_916 [Pseudomonadota bacterium]|jgi:general secretion pathway protein G